MKRLVYPALLLFLIGFSSCKKLISFKMEYDDTATIPANALINIPFDIVTQQQTTNSQQTFENNGTASDLISRVELTNLDLSILTPASEDFNFLKSVEIFLSAPELSEIRVAYNTNVPNNGLRELPLTCEDHDLKEYLKKSSYSIRVKAETDEAITQNVEVNIHSKFTVDAGLF